MSYVIENPMAIHSMLVKYMFNDIRFPRFSTPALRTRRKIGTKSDAALGVEGLERVATVLALECCFAFKV